MDMPTMPTASLVTLDARGVVCWSLVSVATLTNSSASSGSLTVAVTFTVMFVSGGSS